MDVPATAFGGHGASGWLTSGPMRTPKRFDLLGAGWEMRGAIDAEVRARAAGGPWSRWVPLRAAADHGPDGEPPFRGSDPVWFGGAELVEVRSRRPLAGLRLHLVNSTGTATPADRRRSAVRRALATTAALPTVRVAPGAPPIVPRSAWAGGGARPSAPALYGEVDLAFVHHTESGNDYAPSDSPAMILAIFHFHRDVRGWNDVGYNFLVDKYGQVFEGRAGGMLEAVVGAQAGGFNKFSTGAALLGSHMSVAAGAPEIDALGRLLAWKLTYHGVPVVGHVTVTYAGSADKYRHGARVLLNRIAGHRDGNATDCPGNALYAQLPDLRQRVARYAAAQPTTAGETAPTLAASAPRIKAGRPVTLSGTTGGVATGLALLVERQTSGGYARSIAPPPPPAGGRFQAQVALPRPGLYRITARGTDHRGLPLRSAPIFITASR
jgi:hypothetical protein